MALKHLFQFLHILGSIEKELKLTYQLPYSMEVHSGIKRKKFIYINQVHRPHRNCF